MESGTPSIGRAANLVDALTRLSPGSSERLATANELLAYIVDTGDMDAALSLARAVDQDLLLEETLNPRFDELLHQQPDVIYRMARTRLALGSDVDWRFRLRQSALAALHIAITDGDTETVLNWLTLVSREPSSYELGDLLYHGILAAQIRVEESQDFARSLVLLALKRAPAALDALLENAAVVQALPVELRAALLDGTGDALGLSSTYGTDAWLAVCAWSAEHRWANVFTTAVLERLWQCSMAGAGAALPTRMQVVHTLETLTASGHEWLDPRNYEHLVTLALRHERDVLAVTMIGHLVERADGNERLADIIAFSGRPPSDWASLISSLSHAGVLTSVDAILLLEQLISRMDWQPDSVPLIHLWARLSIANPSTANDELLWQMLVFASDFDDELAARASMRQLTARFEQVEDENILVMSLERLFDLLDQHPGVMEQALTWWRLYTLKQSAGRLNRLDKAMEGKRQLQDVQAVAQTISACRRLLGKRTLRDFAADIHIMLGVVEALEDSFGSETRKPMNFDAESMRAELDRHDDELSEQERHILANDLKAIGHLIGLLGDHRTKASLIRREEEVDRQLVQGDQEPHGAVDILKWMSGYLGGWQTEDADRA